MAKRYEVKCSKWEQYYVWAINVLILKISSIKISGLISQKLLSLQMDKHNKKVKHEYI